MGRRGWKGAQEDKEVKDREEECRLRARHPRRFNKPSPRCLLYDQDHLFANCPFCSYEEEPERPQPKREEPECPQPKWEEPEHPQPKREEPERPQPEWEEPEPNGSLFWGSGNKTSCSETATGGGGLLTSPSFSVASGFLFWGLRQHNPAAKLLLVEVFS
ncbi:UNVERIFIED_CONTAM: hypothetical protein FKN15_068966 [Acipenser sinensis]